jgi:hypothetical protein
MTIPADAPSPVLLPTQAPMSKKKPPNAAMKTNVLMTFLFTADPPLGPATVASGPPELPAPRGADLSEHQS